VIPPESAPLMGRSYERRSALAAPGQHTSTWRDIDALGVPVTGWRVDSRKVKPGPPVSRPTRGEHAGRPPLHRPGQLVPVPWQCCGQPRLQMELRMELAPGRARIARRTWGHRQPLLREFRPDTYGCRRDRHQRKTSLRALDRTIAVPPRRKTAVSNHRQRGFPARLKSTLNTLRRP